MAKSNRTASPYWNAWRHIRQITTNPRNKDYWWASELPMLFDGFDDFAQHMAEEIGLPTPDRPLMTRRDLDRGYEPGNMMWSSREEISSRSRSSVRFTWRGRTMCVAQWARVLGIHSDTLNGRIRKGWPVAVATKPLDFRRIT